MVQVCRASNPGRKGTLDASVTFDEAAHIVPIFAIPLTPHIPVGEGPNLVQTPTVPWLCYQLHLHFVAKQTLDQLCISMVLVAV